MTNKLAAIEKLQTRYVMALDKQDMAGWLACFSQDPEVSYICISAENERQGHSLALMYDVGRGKIEDRVSIVTKVWVGTYEPYTTRHFVQLLDVQAVGDNRYEASAQFILTMTPAGGTTSVLTTGLYQDLIQKVRFLCDEGLSTTRMCSPVTLYFHSDRNTRAI